MAETYEHNTQENKVTKTSIEQNMDIQPKAMPRKRKKEDPPPKAMPRQKKKNDEKEKKDGDEKEKKMKMKRMRKDGIQVLGVQPRLRVTATGVITDRIYRVHKPPGARFTK